MKKITSLALVYALALSACTTAGPTGQMSQGQTLGTLGGAVAGGFLGSRFGQGDGKTAAIIGGALLGGLIGNQIGLALDEQSRQRAMTAEYNALEYGRSGAATTWRNPDRGTYGEVVPGPSTSNNCRTYTHTIYIDGQAQVAKGTACRNNDGTWRTVS